MRSSYLLGITFQTALLLLLLPELVQSELRVRVAPFGAMDEARLQQLSSAVDDEDVADFGVYGLVVSGNTSTESVTVDFTWPSGMVVTQMTDFRKQSQILRVLVPGEMELGQPNYQAFCFVSSFSGDMIPPEAVMKLRQKSPSTIRVADQEETDVVYDSNILLNANPAKLAFISSHLQSFCRDARESTYSSEHELFTILDTSGGPSIGEVGHEALANLDSLARCFSISDRNQACVCSLQICFDWYPCSLRLCGDHRCGIKTCRKCVTHRFGIKAKVMCMWDEA